jgi:acyl-CoA oxidase
VSPQECIDDLQGHGSDVASLETEARYDPRDDTFSIVTPSLTSTKWWAGGMGLCATHAVVFARLLVPENLPGVSPDAPRHNGWGASRMCAHATVDYGVHPFVCQIRCCETLATLPGVEAGDIGPKIGYNQVDNGFMRLRVSVPRETHMLMGNARLERNGRFLRTSHPRAHYGSMLALRAVFVE